MIKWFCWVAFFLYVELVYSFQCIILLRKRFQILKFAKDYKYNQIQMIVEVLGIATSLWKLLLFLLLSTTLHIVFYINWMKIHLIVALISVSLSFRRKKYHSRSNIVVSKVLWQKLLSSFLDSYIVKFIYNILLFRSIPWIFFGDNKRLRWPNHICIENWNTYILWSLFHPKR